MAEMEPLEFKIVGDDSSAVNSLRHFEDAISRINKAAGRTTGLNRFSNATKSAGKRARAFSKILSAFNRVVFYRAIRSAIKALEDSFNEGLQNAYAFSAGLSDIMDRRIATSLDNLASNSAKMKNQLGASFGSMLAAVTPFLITLINWVTRAANAVTQFFAAITGTTYLKAKDISAKFAQNMKTGAAAAKEWKNQLLAFDVINKLEEPSQGGGGGSGTRKIDPKDMYEVEKVSSKMQEIASRLNTITAKLKIDFKDVFFNWSDLNPESIEMKAITGLSAALGGSTGFILGGVPGAIVGTLLGAFFGLSFSSVKFNNDGVLSKDEVIGELRTVLYGLTGGIIGFLAGGVPGALLGITAGALIELGLSHIELISNGKASGFVKDLTSVLATFTAGAIGWFVGGPLGAAIGASATLGIRLFISKIKPEIPEKSKYSNPVVWFFNGVIGFPTDQEIIAYCGNIIKWIADGFAEFGHELELIFVQPFRDMWDSLTSWWSSLSLPAFHIPTPKFEWTYSEATGVLADALKFVGLPPTLPHLNISWNAKGGIVDGATLIGAGEAGKEAILPLERNTGWMKLLAFEINRQREEYSADDDAIVTAIYAIGSMIVSEMRNNDGGSGGDWDGFVRSVTRTQQRQASAYGV